MTKLFVKILFLFPLLALIGIVNYTVDPENIFLNEEKIDKATDYLIEGKHLANVANIDMRTLKKKYIEKIEDPKDVIVIGSSRTMKITEDLIEPYSFFNLSVSGCLIPDYYAFVNVMEEQDKLPEVIILGFDQWLFGNNYKTPHYHVYLEEYEQMLNKLNLSPLPGFPVTNTFDRYTEYKELTKELFSFRAFIKSIQVEDNQLAGKTKLSNKSMILSDGSRWRPKKRKEELETKMAIRYPEKGRENFTKIAQSNYKAIDEIIKYLIRKNIKTILYIPPYHPETYKILTHSDTMIDEIDSVYKEIAVKNEAAILGATNPDKLGLTPVHFQDGVHLKHTGVEIIFSDIDTIIKKFVENENQKL